MQACLLAGSMIGAKMREYLEGVGTTAAGYAKVSMENENCDIHAAAQNGHVECLRSAVEQGRPLNSSTICFV